ncbi:DUF5820 family protein [Haloarchaeobius iranensis]|uniref:Uncharacterized protein n=1 Tax=Haloarchaeobius iranensis TaxID=996166 RepID=A0A1G9Y1A1_9EURY|nr:DUF5820 family protein [Haloarchaeobius iranensis]SDN02770.1 hypothetical protein SAMN05192554_11297 [Haloarchaeobius iranensis]
MSDFADLPDGWVVWNEEPDGRCVLAYRPDVFDSAEFPAPCLPTLYLTRGRRNHRRPGVSREDAVSGDWYVTLYLEPDVQLQETNRFESREAGVAGTVELAQRFADGEIDPDDVYQVPREEYIAKLHALTGQS